MYLHGFEVDVGAFLHGQHVLFFEEASAAHVSSPAAAVGGVHIPQQLLSVKVDNL